MNGKYNACHVKVNMFKWLSICQKRLSTVGKLCLIVGKPSVDTHLFFVGKHKFSKYSKFCINENVNRSDISDRCAKSTICEKLDCITR